MNKLSFRARALDTLRPMPIFLSEELPDLPEYLSISRSVPQMPSGMEKEEESERHLQDAINCGKIIPTPELFSLDDLGDYSRYERLYPAACKLPKHYIHYQSSAFIDEKADYDIDSDDERWLEKHNKGLASTEKLRISVVEFETMIDRLEKGSSCKRVVTMSEASLLLRDTEHLVSAVYQYWLSKRLNAKHSLMPYVLTDRSSTSSAGSQQTVNSPYIAFRRRLEKMQTRKNRKNDEISYQRMLKLRRDLLRVLTLLQMVKQRESLKQEYLQLTKQIFKLRYKAGDLSGDLTASILSRLTRSSAANHIDSNTNLGAANTASGDSTKSTILSTTIPHSSFNSTKWHKHTNGAISNVNTLNAKRSYKRRLKSNLALVATKSNLSGPMASHHHLRPSFTKQQLGNSSLSDSADKALSSHQHMSPYSSSVTPQTMSQQRSAYHTTAQSAPATHHTPAGGGAHTHSRTGALGTSVDAHTVHTEFAMYRTRGCQYHAPSCWPGDDHSDSEEAAAVSALAGRLVRRRVGRGGRFLVHTLSRQQAHRRLMYTTIRALQTAAHCTHSVNTSVSAASTDAQLGSTVAKPPNSTHPHRPPVSAQPGVCSLWLTDSAICSLAATTAVTSQHNTATVTHHSASTRQHSARLPQHTQYSQAGGCTVYRVTDSSCQTADTRLRSMLSARDGACGHSDRQQGQRELEEHVSPHQPLSHSRAPCVSAKSSSSSLLDLLTCSTVCTTSTCTAAVIVETAHTGQCSEHSTVTGTAMVRKRIKCEQLVAAAPTAVTSAPPPVAAVHKQLVTPDYSRKMSAHISAASLLSAANVHKERVVTAALTAVPVITSHSHLPKRHSNTCRPQVPITVPSLLLQAVTSPHSAPVRGAARTNNTSAAFVPASAVSSYQSSLSTTAAAVSLVTSHHINYSVMNSSYLKQKQQQTAQSPHHHHHTGTNHQLLVSLASPPECQSGLHDSDLHPSLHTSLARHKSLDNLTAPSVAQQPSLDLVA